MLFRSGNYEDIEQWLAEGRVDCGFLRSPTADTLEPFPILKEKFMAIFAEGRYPSGTTFTFEQLKNEPYLLRPDTLDGELSKFLKKGSYRPKIVYSYKDDLALMPLIEQGLGMSILPELLMKDTPYRLEKFPLYPPVFREIVMVHKKNATLPPATRQFISFVKSIYAPQSNE